MIVHQVEVIVCDAEGGRLGDAGVTLASELDGGTIEARFQEGRRLYYFDKLRPGFFQATVHQEGYQSESRRVQVHHRATRQVFILARPGERTFRQGGIQVPFSPKPDLIGVFLDPAVGDSSANHSALLALFQDLSLIPLDPRSPEKNAWETRRLTPALLLQTDPPVSETAELALEVLRSHSLVAAAGPVANQSDGRFSVFTHQAYVRFRPEVSGLERNRLLEANGLRAVRPLHFAPNLFLVETELKVGLGVHEQLDRLMLTNRCDYAEPALAQVPQINSVTPADYLWPGVWDRSLVGLEDAWEKLKNGLGPDQQFGSPEIAIAVVDSGVKSVNGEPEASDFQGTVTDGTGTTYSKTYKLLNFNSLAPDNDQLNPRNLLWDPFPSGHGVACAGVALGRAEDALSGVPDKVGTAGAAPNTRLIGLAYPLVIDLFRLEMYLWAAGLDARSMRPGFPTRIDPGADIFTVSITFGVEAPPSLAEADMYAYIATYGRKGKGCLPFEAAGNSARDVTPFSPSAHYVRNLVCSASTLADDGVTEIFAPYSNFGDSVEWCAPSNDEAVHNPPASYRTWTSALRSMGNLPSVPMARTTLGADASATDTSVTVADSSTLVPGSFILVGEPGTPGSEPLVVLTEPDPTTGALSLAKLDRTVVLTLGVGFSERWDLIPTGLLNDHPTGTDVISGARKLTELTSDADTNATVLEVADVSGLVAGMEVILVDQEIKPLFLHELVTITSTPGAGSGTVQVTALTNDHDSGTSVVIAAADHRNDFSWRSCATAPGRSIWATPILSANGSIRTANRVRFPARLRTSAGGMDTGGWMPTRPWQGRSPIRFRVT